MTLRAWHAVVSLPAASEPLGACSVGVGSRGPRPPRCWLPCRGAGRACGGREHLPSSPKGKVLPRMVAGDKDSFAHASSSRCPVPVLRGCRRRAAGAAVAGRRCALHPAARVKGASASDIHQKTFNAQPWSGEVYSRGWFPFLSVKKSVSTW